MTNFLNLSTRTGIIENFYLNFAKKLLVALGLQLLVFSAYWFLHVTSNYITDSASNQVVGDHFTIFCFRDVGE